MKQHKDNPKTNVLSSGVTEADLFRAVNSSGYPLQSVISNLLRNDFIVTDEWCYVDSNTKELRNIDLLATKWLYNYRKDEPKVRPALNLLIECKQSDLPYVFFLTPDKPYLLEFPIIAGLKDDRVRI